MDIPAAHRTFLDEVVPRIAADDRVTAIALSGSLAHGTPDDFSDVDLVLAIRDDAHAAVMSDRLELIASWTDVVVGFTGEHVGEPRLIVSLVAPPVLHVDFTFLPETEFATVLHRLRLLHGLGVTPAADSASPELSSGFDPQWAEDRFWVWVHYGATKLARGELFETLDTVAALRKLVLGPLASRRAGAEPRGVRRLESIAPDDAVALQSTVSGYDQREAADALLAAVELYRRWRPSEGVTRRPEAERLVMGFLGDVLGGLQPVRTDAGPTTDPRP
ncbi:hypothetical protein [Leifsonia shinshuensis]|uniref:hypothetical protein n=1 Tax=Leifsonia shinshuensis TaxID=150026 RepID=UPI002854B515|nr:hypothetical protein [Leifsonia shinshuensis]MDR6972790.1 putative nucleotidyltransferase [Leifsonia shinshuensis]